MVWSQEAFCHAMDHQALIAEVQRCLKPGGTAVFSDIMQSDNGGDCTSFTGQNVTTELASPQTYKVPPPAVPSPPPWTHLWRHPLPPSVPHHGPSVRYWPAVGSSVANCGTVVANCGTVVGWYNISILSCQLRVAMPGLR